MTLAFETDVKLMAALDGKHHDDDNEDKKIKRYCAIMATYIMRRENNPW
jgi:hypothetical protein